MEFHAGRACKVALAQRNKSRAWLAGELGVSPQMASTLLNRESVSLGTLKKLAGLFGLDLSEYIRLGEFESHQE